MKRLSILALILIGGCAPKEQQLNTTIPRPAPDEATPSGIAYLCEGRREVSVVYAKNRASVTLGDRTWRMEYQGGGQGFRYADSATEWSGAGNAGTLKALSGGTPLASNCQPMRRTT
ncbi:MliC family protein [Reyranella sp.]|uniref:MliC family protein n=1 Tax=Reyranella sp. TaxID=1929291 RepID=UPI003BAAD591